METLTENSGKECHLNAGRQPGQLPGRDDDPSLLQHGREDGQHGVDAASVVVLRQVARLFLREKSGRKEEA